jgi:FtsP/CotA-like multicopper oxidase with cupredoxin domain
MDKSRRTFLRGAFALTALFGAGNVAKARGQDPDYRGGEPASAGATTTPLSPGRSNGTDFTPIETPDVPKLPWRMDNGVKVFHLTAEVVKREFLPGKVFDVWGYNGLMPGPTIEAHQGDRVRFIFDNHLPEATSMHWHGLEVPIEMDGVPGISQDLIQPGGRFVYEFTLHQDGVFFYHSHMAMQEMMGMIGLFIIHPKESYQPRVDKDFGLILQEWAILPNNTIPNSLSMEFNWLTINGRSGPATTPLIVRLGDRVRIRIVNLGMDHHPVHLHGNTFYVTATEGGRVPQPAWTPGNTVLVGVAQARVIEFEAKYVGDWMMHCHMPHHMMNQMASMVGPMTRGGGGMKAGRGMQEGMGMLRQGHALADEHGPSLGRAMGIGSDVEQPTTNLSLPMHHDMAVAPGYPQDMFMPMDDEVVKPETYGLKRNWTGGMMGMMTLVRVLEPKLYDKIKSLQVRAAAEKPARNTSGAHSRHG